jgi:acyl-CoA thioesterase
MKSLLIISLFLYQGIVIPEAKPPETLQEAQKIGQEFLEQMPQETEKAWQEALVIWKGMYDKAFTLSKRFWQEKKGVLIKEVKSLWLKAIGRLGEK